MLFQFSNLKILFDRQPLRIRLMTLSLSTLTMIIVIYFFSIYPLISELQHNQSLKDFSNEKIFTLTNHIQQAQLLKSSPLFKDWLNQHKKDKQLKHTSDNLIAQSASTPNDVSNVIFQSYPNILVSEINEYPVGNLKRTNDVNKKNKVDKPNFISQQQFQIVFRSDYFSTLQYLMFLQEKLPNIHWNDFSYHVTAYPQAKVNLIFTVFYNEKN